MEVRARGVDAAGGAEGGAAQGEVQRVHPDLSQGAGARRNQGLGHQPAAVQPGCAAEVGAQIDRHGLKRTARRDVESQGHRPEILPGDVAGPDLGQAARIGQAPDGRHAALKADPGLDGGIPDLSPEGDGGRHPARHPRETARDQQGGHLEIRQIGLQVGIHRPTVPEAPAPQVGGPPAEIQGVDARPGDPGPGTEFQAQTPQQAAPPDVSPGVEVEGNTHGGRQGIAFGRDCQLAADFAQLDALVRPPVRLRHQAAEPGTDLRPPAVRPPGARADERERARLDAQSVQFESEEGHLDRQGIQGGGAGGRVVGAGGTRRNHFHRPGLRMAAPGPAAQRIQNQPRGLARLHRGRSAQENVPGEDTAREHEPVRLHLQAVHPGRGIPRHAALAEVRDRPPGGRRDGDGRVRRRRVRGRELRPDQGDVEQGRFGGQVLHEKVVVPQGVQVHRQGQRPDDRQGVDARTVHARDGPDEFAALEAAQRRPRPAAGDLPGQGTQGEPEAPFQPEAPARGQQEGNRHEQDDAQHDGEGPQGPAQQRPPDARPGHHGYPTPKWARASGSPG